MQQTEIVTLPVTDMNSEGVGICKQDGMVVFVPGMVTGDVIVMQRTSQQKNYAMGVCKSIVTASPHRIESDCPYTNTCGGCTLRHIDRAMELSVKENTVRQALRRMHLTITEGDIRPILATAERGYRNKAVFHFGENGALGYYARESHDVMPGSTCCVLLPPVMGKIARYTEVWCQKNTPDLHPASLYLRQNEKGECTVVLQTRTTWAKEAQDHMRKYAAAMMTEFPNVIGVMHSDMPTGKYAVPCYTVISGKRYVWEDYMGLRMRISPEGFCQVNKRGAELLMETVLSFAKTVEKEHAFAADLYCGSGFFGLQLAYAFPNWQLYGIEISEASIRDAEVNRIENGLSNIEFQAGDVAALCRTKGEPLALTVIDPPRAGCSEKMRKQLLAIAPEKIVYVSCNPQTLARDLAALVQGSYTIEVVQPVDMFPRTGHVECVVLMSRVKD